MVTPSRFKIEAESIKFLALFAPAVIALGRRTIARSLFGDGFQRAIAHMAFSLSRMYLLLTDMESSQKYG
jgi:hypothetical protein